jgi:26S proteasome regulatory subunit N2
VYKQTKDTDILSYATEAVPDGGFTTTLSQPDALCLSYSFPHPHSHYSLITIINGSIPLPGGFSGKCKELAIANQIAFDLVKGGQEYLDAVRSRFPEKTVEAVSMPNHQAFKHLSSILGGEPSILLYGNFLEWNNHADQLILKDTKDALDGQSSIFHLGLTFSNAFMHASTNSDEFLQNNHDCLARHQIGRNSP